MQSDKGGTRFKSSSTGETFRIRQHITCFFQRISNYLSQIEVKYNEGTIAAHFFEGNCTINHFSKMGIAQLEDPPKRKPGIRIKLEKLEG